MCILPRSLLFFESAPPLQFRRLIVPPILCLKADAPLRLSPSPPTTQALLPQPPFTRSLPPRPRPSSHCAPHCPCSHSTALAPPAFAHLSAREHLFPTCPTSTLQLPSPKLRSSRLPAESTRGLCSYPVQHNCMRPPHGPPHSLPIPLARCSGPGGSNRCFDS